MPHGLLRHVVQRRSRLAWRLFFPGRAKLVYDRLYRSSITGLPLDPYRADQILSFLAREGLIRPDDIITPDPASLRTLALAHDHDYLESLNNSGALTSILGVEVSDHERERVLQLQRLMVGGTIRAVQIALNTRYVGVNLGGGFHHARPERGAGFCVFNDVAAAIQDSRTRGFSGRVLVIDCDLHDGDGTRLMFRDDASVYTYSLHNDTWSDLPAMASTSIALGASVDDDTYLRALGETLPHLVEEWRPELVIYLAGADPAHDDAIGNWKITADGLYARDQLVLSLVRRSRKKIPLAIVLAGGYGGEAWRYNARLLGLLFANRRIEPPNSQAMTLARYRYFSRLLRHRVVGTTTPESEDLNLTEEDLAGTLGYHSRGQRFLGHYSPHGIELAFEQYGILDHLRGLGFEQPVVEIDADPLRGHTLKLFGRPDRKELLVELRAQIDRHIVAGFDVLNVGWMLLQNPRGRFTARRPQLPGQEFPGLGALQEVSTLLVLVCEQVHLHGVVFSTTHYHLGAVSRRYTYFYRPEEQARFLAIGRAVRGLSLAEASWAIAEDRLIDLNTAQPFRWESFPVVLPASPSLKRYLDNSERDRLIAQMSQHYRYTVVPKTSAPGA